MNVLYLKYAVEVAKAGSINKAAESLFVAQPNLSRAIKELEKDLGVVIFDRNAKGMTLTHDGELLIQYGKRILKELDEVESVFKEGASERKRFSLSAPRASYVAEAFSDFVSGLNTDKMEVLYKETNSSETIKNVSEEGYGLGIVRYAESYDKFYKQTLEEKNLVAETVTEFKYELLFNRNSPLAEKEKISTSDLENLTEIAHADHYVPTLPVAAVRRAELSEGVGKRIFVFERASQFEILSKNKSAFMWVSPVSDVTLDRYGLIERECEENAKRYKDVIIYRKDYRLTELDKAFITRLVEVKRRMEKKKG